MTFFLMMQKEWKELTKTYRILFIPIFFTILMVMQPITTKLLPVILKNAGNLSPGTEFKFATPTAIQVIGTVLSKFELLGALILILITMGAIAGERQSGVAAMVLVKPVGRAKYFFAKAVSYSLLAILSLFVGMIVSAYYTQYFFGDLSWSHIVLGSVAYIPILVMIVSITLFSSSFIKSPVSAGGVSLLLYLVLTMVPQYFGKTIKTFTPSDLSANVVNMLTNHSYQIAHPVIGVSVVALIFLIAGWYLLEKQEI